MNPFRFLLPPALRSMLPAPRLLMNPSRHPLPVTRYRALALLVLSLALQNSLHAQAFGVTGNNNSSSNSRSVIVSGTNNTIQTNVTNSFIGAGSFNIISNSANGSFLAGGERNIVGVGATNAIVAGGWYNRANGFASSVVGGGNNIASQTYASIFGGNGNRVDGFFSTVVGGYRNSASNGYYATVIGGQSNSAVGSGAIVLGGYENIAGQPYTLTAGYRAVATNVGARVFSDFSSSNVFGSTANNQFLIRAAGGVGINTNNPQGNALFVNGSARVATNLTVDGNLNVTGTINGTFSNATFASLTVTGPITNGLSNTVGPGNAAVGGGRSNNASALLSTIGGGEENAASGQSATIAGGARNQAAAFNSFVGGGSDNRATAFYASVMGGFNNTASGEDSTVAGGFQNTSSGNSSFVAGGSNNVAAGNFSFAAGRQAKALNEGAFVWADAQAADFASTGTNQFLIRASGGVGINTTNPGTNALLVGGATRITGDLQVDGTINGTITNFTASSLVTTNDSPVELKPGNNTGFEVTPRGTASLALTNPDVVTTYIGTGHNIVGGYDTHFVRSGVVGATIAGGGQLVVSNEVDGAYTNWNQVFDHFGTVSGGTGNSADGLMATVSGGSGNWAGGHWATIGGGLDNSIYDPTNIPSFALDISTIAGGYFNQVLNAPGGTIGGGSVNLITNTNVLTTNNLQWPATIAGGAQNVSTNAGGSFIGGGSENTVNGEHGVVAGGANNIAGEKATVPGGMSNKATGVGSFAAGVNAEALHDYSFVWGGSPTVKTVSSTNGDFTVLAPGGVNILTTADSNTGAFLQPGESNWTNTPTPSQDQISPQGAGVSLDPNSTSWASLSDSNAKTAVTPIDHGETLRKLAALPVTTWNYKHDPKRRYIGPMAQDFHAAFGLGADDKHISTLDTDGVTLSAIKGLVEEIEEQDAALAERDARLEALEKQVEALRRQANL